MTNLWRQCLKCIHNLYDNSPNQSHFCIVFLNLTNTTINVFLVIPSIMFVLFRQHTIQDIYLTKCTLNSFSLFVNIRHVIHVAIRVPETYITIIYWCVRVRTGDLPAKSPFTRTMRVMEHGVSCLRSAAANIVFPTAFTINQDTYFQNRRIVYMRHYNQDTFQSLQGTGPWGIVERFIISCDPIMPLKV